MKAQISSIAGNSQKLDGGAMFGNAPKAVWAKWMPPDSANRVSLSCRALLLEVENKKILCETGIGAFFNPELSERYGVETPDRHLLLENLGRLGVSDSNIDYVILSHLHFDHAGGLLSKYEEGKAPRLLFPRAKYIVGRTAWERALSPHPRDRASFIPELQKLLEESGRLVIVEGNRIPGVLEQNLEFLFTEGHTPGHMHTLFKGEKSSLFFAGDLIPGTPWIHTPITMGYDRYPEKLVDEKTQIYQRALSENWLLFYTHDPAVSASYIQKDEKGRIRPKDPLPELNRYLI